METIKNYISSSGNCPLPTQEQLDQILKQYPWFGTARQLRSHVSGVVDPLSALALYGRPTPNFFMQSYCIEDALRRTDKEIIESFLHGGEHRIVPKEDTPDFLDDLPYVDTTTQDKGVFTATIPPPDAIINVKVVEDEEDLIVEAECGDEPEIEQQTINQETTQQKEVNTEHNRLIVSFIPIEDDEFITEELAQIYLDQEFYDQAKAIYSRLSLLNPEKSVYFAEIINRIELFKMAQSED